MADILVGRIVGYGNFARSCRVLGCPILCYRMGWPPIPFVSIAFAHGSLSVPEVLGGSGVQAGSATHEESDSCFLLVGGNSIAGSFTVRVDAHVIVGGCANNPAVDGSVLMFYSMASFVGVGVPGRGACWVRS